MQVNAAASLPIADAAAGRNPEKVESAAREFEALLIAKMLKDARASGSMTPDGEEGSKDSVMEYAEQQMSNALAGAGGLGLATLVRSGLRAQPDPGQRRYASANS